MKKMKQIDWILPLILSLICVACIFAMLDLKNTEGIPTACIAAVIVWAPFVVSRFTPIKIPNILQVLVVIHCFLGVFLGSAVGLFYSISFWDTMLHTWSGVLFCLLLMWLLIFTKEKIGLFNFIVYAIAFSSMAALLWEVWEFFMDTVKTGSNMQKFALEDGTLLIGRDALKDTMEDLICNFIGALAFSIAYLIDYRFNKSKIINAIEKDFAN